MRAQSARDKGSPLLVRGQWEDCPLGAFLAAHTGDLVIAAVPPAPPRGVPAVVAGPHYAQKCLRLQSLHASTGPSSNAKGALLQKRPLYNGFLD